MRKLAIFNVGGALSSYIEFDDKKIVVDLGNSTEFSPVDNFLIPLMEHRHVKKVSVKIGELEQQRYNIDQLFMSHLDNDHISDYEKFMENFYPTWMTCPNNNDRENQNQEKQEDHFKINPDLLGQQNDIRDRILDDMRQRCPLAAGAPLGSISENIELFFIKPVVCELEDDLRLGYQNNISLVLYIMLGEKTVLMPGDLLKDATKHLIENNIDLKNKLNTTGVDFLIAPHHGLSTSFPENLFQELKGNKARLNIISEKTRSNNSNENRSEVDSRYYSPDYSSGDNSLNQYGVKTSMGHIVIDLESDENEIRQISDEKDLLNEFI